MKTLIKLFLRLFLLILTLFLVSLFSILGFTISAFYYIFSLKWKTGIQALSNYIYQICLSLDQLGNVTCQNIFNITLVKRKEKYHPFGDEDDTISYCIAMNNKNNTLSNHGKFWASFLNIVDPSEGGHLYKTLIMKIKRDNEACIRVNNP